MSETPTDSKKWPLEDGGEYVIASDAINWQDDTTFRISHLVMDETDKIGGPQKRKITRSDMIGCYLRALRTLESEVERELTGCEHGIADGDWCEDCNREYKEARHDPDNA